MKASFPKLDVYAEQGIDRMGLLAFFEAYTSPQKYPIIGIELPQALAEPRGGDERSGLARITRVVLPGADRDGAQRPDGRRRR